MKVVILAGGKGSRISEYTTKIPKPMIKLMNKPIIEHIINFYALYGYKEFIIAGGYKYKILLDFIKKNKKLKKLKIKVINTGLNSLTGKRIFKIKKFLDKEDENFLLTYGDGICNVDLKKMIRFHIKNKSMLTLTAVRPPARFGELGLKNNRIVKFEEKPQMQEGWINGGFFVVNKSFFKYLTNDNLMLEREPINKISKTKKMFAFRHSGFWKCIDTKRDLEQFENIVKSKKFNLNNFESK